MKTISQKYANFSPYQEDDTFEIYINCLYLGISIMGSNISGDVLPLTPSEQIYATFVTLVSKLNLAFLFGEVANLISGFYSAYIEHLNRTRLIVDWLKYNSCDQRLIDRVVKYRNILWHKCKGIDDQGLVTELPESLRKEVRMQILEHLVQNADVIPKDDTGPVLSIIERLAIRLFPRGEFIIREGEIALEMYLLAEGVVDICGPEGKRICRLTPGKCFGEMALLKDCVQTRMASAYCVTDVTVAVFKKDDFVSICDSYPQFKLRIAETVREREEHNMYSAHDRDKEGKGESERDHEEASSTFRPLAAHNISKGTDDTSCKVSTTAGKRTTVSAFVNMMETRSLYDGEMGDSHSGTDYAGMSTGSFVWLAIRTCACLYNIYFIPLQMAFRISYTPAIYCVEVLVMALHLADIVGWVLRYRRYRRMVFAEDAETPDFSADKKYTPATVAGKRRKALRKIVLECLTFLPWSMILQTVHYPTYVIFIIKMLRAMKVWPAKRFTGELEKRWPNLVRICQVIVLYNIIAHLMACSYILMMYVADSKNESWVKRIPYPQTDMYGFRSGDDMTGVTNYDIYCHALYFAYIIFTHISIGDMCAVNINERVVMCVYIGLSIHIYAFLFANITSMVTDLSRGLLSSLQTRYEAALRCTKAETLPPDLVNRIKAYFDFLWVDTRGIDDKFLSELPISLKVDICLQLYKHAIEHCILFRKPSGEFDKPAATSFIKMIKIRKYMKGDILIKAGSLHSKIHLLLEGELLLVGINLEKIGAISPGLIFGAKSGDEERSPAHLVATKICTVAVVARDSLDLFLEIFPHVRGNFELSNEILYKRCRTALDAYANSLSSPVPASQLLEAVLIFVYMIPP